MKFLDLAEFYTVMNDIVNNSLKEERPTLKDKKWSQERYQTFTILFRHFYLD